MTEEIRCPDCDVVSEEKTAQSNGRCSFCHGTGYITDVVVLMMSMGEDERECEVCGGSGICQTCFGKGYIEP